MPRIIVLSGADVGLDVEVAEGALFGRADDCPVRLRDASVSRHHARLERGASGFEVVDLGSRNGIARTGARSERIPLSHGAEFTLGALLIRFVDPPAGEVEEIVLAPATPAVPAAGPAPGAPPPAAGGASASVGAARRQAIASQQGVLQYHRIEAKGGSLMTDEVSQLGGWMRLLLIGGAALLAVALFYGSWKLAFEMTPEPPVEEGR